jgi:hypothetical protein
VKATLRHEIPTHLNVEDKAFFGLSVRQVMVLTSGCAVGYGLWTQNPDVPSSVRLAGALACLFVALVLALGRPGGRPFEEWGVIALRYALLPKRSVWRPEREHEDPRRPNDDRFSDLSLSVVWADSARPAGSEPGQIVVHDGALGSEEVT